VVNAVCEWFFYNTKFSDRFSNLLRFAGFFIESLLVSISVEICRFFESSIVFMGRVDVFSGGR
jgi:hypothetical protein